MVSLGQRIDLVAALRPMSAVQAKRPVHQKQTLLGGSSRQLRAIGWTPRCGMVMDLSAVAIGDQCAMCSAALFVVFRAHLTEIRHLETITMCFSNSVASLRYLGFS